MTQEQKTKAYDEALEKAKSMIDDLRKGEDILAVSDLESMFPELAESEDERIRKEILEFVTIVADSRTNKMEWIAWLEKQGEQKPIDKVEPKFKVGDWITDGYLHNKITDVLEDRYIVETKFVKRSAILYDYESRYHLWTIQDAKDGDVLLFEGYYNSIVLFQGIGINGKGRINYHCKCDLGNYSFGVQGNMACLGTIEEDAEHYHPATKEQRELLFAKMKDNGYGWDAEKKEVRKIEKQSEKEEVDGFDAELNALLKKYEYLPKEELAECLEFYLKVVNKSEAEMVVKGLNNEWNYQNVMQMLQSIYEVLVSINNKNAPVQIVPYEPPHDLRPYCEVENMDCNTTNKIDDEKSETNM